MVKIIPLATSLAAILMHVGLSCLTSGFSAVTILNLLSGISSTLAADSIKKLSPQKIKQLILGVHPNDFNHSIKRLFFKSMAEALDNVLILYSETTISKHEKREAKKIVEDLKKELNDNNNIHDKKVTDTEIGSFLKDPQSNIGGLANYFTHAISSKKISDSFKIFIADHFPAQIQLCFGEGLKKPNHHDAWVAFQRIMSDEIRDIVIRIEQTQSDIKQDISDIKIGNTGLNKKQWDELKKLNELLNDKERFKVVLNNNVTEALTSIETTANELLRLSTDTNKSVKDLIILHRQQTAREHNLFWLIVGVLAVLLVGGGIVSYYSLTRPFNLMVSVHGWKGKEHQPLKGTGALKIAIDNKVYTSDINKEGNAIFMELPHSYSGKTARVSIDKTDGMPYFCVDSILKVDKKQVAYLSVSIEGIEFAHGYIKDEDTLEPIEGALVRIAGESTYADSFGEFSLPIPLDKQEEYQEIQVYKEGYEPYRVEQPMIGRHDFRLYLNKR